MLKCLYLLKAVLNRCFIFVGEIILLSKMLQLIFILIFTLLGQSQPNAYKIPQSEIEKKVFSYINKSLENTTIIKHEVVNLRIPTNLLVPDKNYVMYIKRNITTPPKGNTTLLLHISVAGEIIKSSSVTCKVKTWEK
ncbi:MAG: hypothetical protein KAR38_16765, partial [Calditrichia bacterium]|nr:hypothetical protein [Calditrichia bacterium]